MKSISKADAEAKRAATPGTFKISDHGTRTFEVGEYTIQYFPNGRGDDGREPNATNFYVRKSTLQDDLQSDYFAGSFRDTLTGAIRSARRMSGPQLRLVGGAS